MTIIDYDKALLERLQTTPKEYISCRDLRHLWRVDQDLHLEGQISGRQRVERSLSCSRCGTVKTEHYVLQTSMNGVQRLTSVGYNYTYPPEYMIPEMARATAPREILRAARFAKNGEVST